MHSPLLSRHKTSSARESDDCPAYWPGNRPLGKARDLYRFLNSAICCLSREAAWFEANLSAPPTLPVLLVQKINKKSGWRFDWHVWITMYGTIFIKRPPHQA